MTATGRPLAEVFFENVRVIDPLSGIDGQFKVYLQQGQLVYLGAVDQPIPAAHLMQMQKSQTPTIAQSGLWLCPAFTDLAFQLTEPGLRYKAPLATELYAAAAAGFHQVVGLPTTLPINDSPAVTGLLRGFSEQIDRAVILPLGALTEQLQGERLSSLRALQLAGCVGVTQDLRAIASSVILLNAYRYAKTFDLTLFVCPQDAYLSALGCVHEGQVAARLGLPAIPVAAETVAVARDIALVKATGVRLHFSRISSADALQLIVQAKASGLPITCDVAITHLIYDEAAVGAFNAHFHLNPPLRSSRDREALLAGLAEGQVDAICTQHCPHEAAAKLAPFAETAAGMATLDTFIPDWLALLNAGVPLARLVQAISVVPQQIVRQAATQIAVNTQANLTLIDPQHVWTYNASTACSAALNSPAVGADLIGKVLATWRQGREIYRLK